MGALDKILHEGSIWNGHRAILSFILNKSIFIYFVHHGTKFYDRYINSYDRKNILMMMGVVFFQNRRLESFILKNISRYMVIEVMLFLEVI